MILKSVTTTTDSCWKKGYARMVRRTVTGSVTTTTDSYPSKEPTRRVRGTVLGFRIIRMGLLTQNLQEPIRTVKSASRPYTPAINVNKSYYNSDF
jgi:hypothetical protein